MDGVPETVPNELNARQLAFGYNFSPIPLQYYDQYKYVSGLQVYTFADGTGKIDFEVLVERFE